METTKEYIKTFEAFSKEYDEKLLNEKTETITVQTKAGAEFEEEAKNDPEKAKEIKGNELNNQFLENIHSILALLGADKDVLELVRHWDFDHLYIDASERQNKFIEDYKWKLHTITKCRVTRM